MGRATTLLYVFVSVCTHACTSTNNSKVACVFEITLPRCLNTLKGMSIPVGPSGSSVSERLTHRNSLTPTSSLYCSPTLYFLVCWLHFPLLMEYRRYEGKSSKFFYGVFHRYIGLVEYSLSHAHEGGEMCTWKNQKKTLKHAHMPLTSTF